MDNPLVRPDVGLFIWTIVTFLVLMALLSKFAWKPLLKALEKRQETIRKSLDDAQEARRELERLQQESAQIVRNAHQEAESIVSKGWSAAEQVREETKQKARAEADAILREARRQIELETGQAVQKIRREAADLSVAIASKIIQRNLTREDNDRLIAEALREMERGKLPS